MSVLAIIPARSGSKGIPGKNFRDLAGMSPVERALSVAGQVAELVVFSSDEINVATNPYWTGRLTGFRACFLHNFRPLALAQDETPMIDVIRHVLAEVPEGDPIVLLQPTQPLREPKHILAALELLQTSGADSVVSVVELPRTHAPSYQLAIDQGRLSPITRCACCGENCDYCGGEWSNRPTARQQVEPSYILDGTVYAFWRRNLDPVPTLTAGRGPFGLAEGFLVNGTTPAPHFYGADCRPLIIPAAESCPLDTPDDWTEAERRLRARTTAT